MVQWQLTDAEWKATAPILVGNSRPQERATRRRGRPRTASARAIAQACLFRFFHSRAPAYRAFGWNELPPGFGVSPATANRRFREWTATGAWSRFWSELRTVRASLATHPGIKSSTAAVKLLEIESPVPAALAELHRAYSFLNARLFENALPRKVVLTIERYVRPKAASGCFSVFDACGHIAIAFSVFGRGPGDIFATVIHEMVHFRNHLVGLPDVHRRYHNRHFRDTAALAGLDCVWTPTLGYGHTHLNKNGEGAVRAFKPKRRALKWTSLDPEQA